MHPDHLQFYIVCNNGQRYVVVNVMLSLMSVISSPPNVCNLWVSSMVKLCTLCSFALEMSLISWIVVTSAFVL